MKKIRKKINLLNILIGFLKSTFLTIKLFYYLKKSNNIKYLLEKEITLKFSKTLSKKGKINFHLDGGGEF